MEHDSEHEAGPAIPPLYKVLNEDGTACIAPNRDQWPLPADGKPGEWMKVTGKLVPCEHGLHLCRRQDLVEWLNLAIFEAEARGRIVVAKDKIVVSEARLLRRLEWNERTARLFAADCAEHVLDALEDRYPSDPRSRKAIEVARLFANSQATEAELAAAHAAAWAAARAAAPAAGAAERQWQTERLFWYLDGEAA